MRLKYFVAGFLAAIILTTGITVLANPEMRQLVFGVNVVVHGETLELDGIDRPFIMEGRTFLPVAVIADALNIPIEWDGETSTVYVGNNSPLTGRWELVGLFGMTQEEIQEDIERFGRVEVAFYGDGRAELVQHDLIEEHRWSSEDGIITWGFMSQMQYEVSGQYLTAIPLGRPDDYAIFRRIN